VKVLAVLRELLRSGDMICGTMVSEVAVPNLAYMLKECGFQFIIIDCEHGSFDYSQVSALLTGARGSMLPAIIRLPDNTRANIIKYLDMGAQGLLLPMTNSLDDIIPVAQMARYPPAGLRGISTTRAHNGYNSSNFSDYIRRANAEVMVFAQLETSDGIADADRILALEGVDGIFIGPNDLSMDLGVFGKLDAPELDAAIRNVASICTVKKKVWGVITSNLPLIRSCREKGMEIVSCGSETGMIIQCGRQLVQNLKHTEQELQDVKCGRTTITRIMPVLPL